MIRQRYEATQAEIAGHLKGGEGPLLLIASKLKPADVMLQCMKETGHLLYGENYVNEMVEKAPALPDCIQLVLIGHLQSNKVKTLIKEVPQLIRVESIDSVKIATKLNQAIEEVYASSPKKTLDVLVQVNVSNEDSKNGVDPNDVDQLVAHIESKCPRLVWRGLMTIASPDRKQADENFRSLKELGDKLWSSYGKEGSVFLSMGMSGDMGLAIKHGTSQLRIGQAILGAR